MLDLFLRAQRTAQINQEYPGTGSTVWAEGANDLQIDPSNDLTTIDGTTRLAQDIIKILITERGTNTILPLYGTNLQSLVGQKMDLQFLQGQVLSEVTDALLILQALNQTNPDLDQQIQTLQSIQVNLETPRQIGIQLVVITKSQKAVGSIVTIV